MRMIVIDRATDLRGLTSRLLGAGAASEGAVENLRRLNPHLNLDSLETGAVVLVPDQPGLSGPRDGGSESVGGINFDEFSKTVASALEASVARVRSGHAERLAQQKDVATLLKSAVLRRALESDPDLKKQLEAVQQGMKNDQQAAKDAETTVKALLEQSASELAALGKLLG